MTLQEQLAAVPAWPPIDTDLSPSDFSIRLSHAALARLALQRTLLLETAERLAVLNDPEQSTKHAAVFTELLLSQHKLDTALAATEPPR